MEKEDLQALLCLGLVHWSCFAREMQGFLLGHQQGSRAVLALPWGCG